MFARGLDVGQMSSTISGRHLADIDSMSGRCLKTIEARCWPDIGKCRPRQRPDVSKIYQADIGKCRLISDRLHVCTCARCRPDVNDIRPTSGRYRLDVGPMSENHRSSMSETISGRHRTDIRPISERLDIGNDIRPTSGPCRKTTGARCWKRYRTDIILYVLQHNIG